MSELTKKQIEETTRLFQELAPEYSHVTVDDMACLFKMRDLALIGLAVQPRPIEDAPKDGSRVLGFSGQWSAPLTVQWYSGIQSWKQHYELPELKDQPTHFIPLSSLPKATP